MSTHLTHKERSGRLDKTEIVPVSSKVKSTGSKLVLLYLTTVGEATIKELTEMLDMKMLALYPMLESLKAEDLIEQRGDTFGPVA